MAYFEWHEWFEIITFFKLKTKHVSCQINKKKGETATFSTVQKQKKCIVFIFLSCIFHSLTWIFFLKETINSSKIKRWRKYKRLQIYTVSVAIFWYFYQWSSFLCAVLWILAQESGTFPIFFSFPFFNSFIWFCRFISQHTHTVVFWKEKNNLTLTCGPEFLVDE